jgi:uncharacterized protein YbaR (Trm112 family)
MKIEVACCPECKEPAKGTLELIPGVAGLIVREDGMADYTGYTDFNYDGQESVIRDNMHVLICPRGHEWKSKIYFDHSRKGPSS